MNDRHYSSADRLLINLDQFIGTVFGKPHTTERANPADTAPETPLSAQEARHSAGLMRVNHAGEVCAQALYQGQALTAELPQIRETMERAAREENDHLDWCQKRIDALGSHTSHLNPFWYLGSFALGAAAGMVGDKWSLGFVAETEHQVVRHLEDHLVQLPENDAKSRAILEQMKHDEQRHATSALRAGGAQLPGPVKKLMSLTSKVMTRAAYWI